MKQIKKFELLFFLFLLLCQNKVSGQAYRMEAGLTTGRSFYMGDSNQSALFQNDKPSWGLLYRYNLNGRFSLKANATVSGISGTTLDKINEYPDGEAFQFDRNVLDAGVQLELNFYEYGMPAYLPGSSRISPYVSLGIGMTGYKAEKKKVCANIPFGVGVKIKALPRLNVGCEWNMRMTFADDLDYSDYGGNFQLSDPWLVSSAGNKNNDWYSMLMLYVSYDLYDVGSKCFK